MASLDLKKDLPIKNFIDDLIEAQGWSNSPILNLDNSNWDDQFVFTNTNARFFRITELSDEEEETLRQDLENVISCLDDSNFCLVYYISGTPEGIELYLGVIDKTKQTGIHEYAQLLTSQLEGNLTGVQFDKVSYEDLGMKIIQPLKNSKNFGLLHGVPSRSIDQQSQTGKSITQGIDRLARGLANETWQMVLVAEPATEAEVNQQINNLLQLSSDLHPFIKQSHQAGINDSETTSITTGSSISHGLTTSTGTNWSDTQGSGTSDTTTHQKGSNSGGGKSYSNNGSSYSNGTSSSWGDNKSVSNAHGTSTNDSKTSGGNTGKSISKNESTNNSETRGSNTGTSKAETIEIINKKIERVQNHINDKLIERFDLGRSKGMFKTAVYLAAPNKVVYDRLTHAMVSIFQGNQSHFSPLEVTPFSPEPSHIQNLFLVQRINKHSLNNQLALIHSIPFTPSNVLGATWLNANEISLLAGLPSREIAGIKLRKNVDFAVNPVNPKQGFALGRVVQYGRKLKNNVVKLDKELIKQHIFISGVTGAGKTTTCQQILLQSDLPFLVIEPAKTEYRSLYQYLGDEIEYYTLGNEKISPFRFNPFELITGESLSGHIDMLKATFTAVFPMEASMPYLIEEAIVRSYQDKGWDINQNENLFYDNPWENPSECFPIFSEVLETLKDVIASKNFGRELQEKYEGSLISRLDNLTLGAKGKMLNTRTSINIKEMLYKKVVIELEDLRDEQDKCLMMGLLLGRIAEAVKHEHKKNHNFQHITLLEEAHRLLSKPQAGEEGSKRLGVEMFGNLLAEVRKYGECLIIADQIPNKLAPEVLKNTNTKIVHRLFASDDRHAIGDTIRLSDEQKDFLTMLQAGEAIVYSAGWHEAVRVKIDKPTDTNAPEIDEAILMTMGLQRIFEQRHSLYPKSSEYFDKLPLSASSFNDLITLAGKVLRFAFLWGVTPNQANIKNRFIHQYKELSEKLIGLDTKQVLIAVFFDIYPIQNKEFGKSYKTIEQLLNELIDFALIDNLLFESWVAKILLEYVSIDSAEGEKTKVLNDISLLANQMKKF